MTLDCGLTTAVKGHFFFYTLGRGDALGDALGGTSFEKFPLKPLQELSGRKVLFCWKRVRSTVVNIRKMGFCFKEKIHRTPSVPMDLDAEIR